ncbi:MAG: hypothetical protein V4760_10475 [Bdellovibrionota bacterium]
MNKPLVDLRVRHERLPVHSKLESSLKRSLVAASFRLDSNSVPDKLTVEGFADAKVPLKRGWRFEASALWSRASEGSLVDFDVSTERDATTNKIREWKREGNQLKFREFVNGEVRREANYDLHEDLVPISSPFLLVSALQSSFTSTNDSYGAVVVIGSKFAAFRLDPVSSGEIVSFRGAVMTSRAPLRRSDWLDLPWHQAKTFDLDWNVERSAVTRVSAEVPIFGSVSLNF